MADVETRKSPNRPSDVRHCMIKLVFIVFLRMETCRLGIVNRPLEIVRIVNGKLRCLLKGLVVSVYSKNGLDALDSLTIESNLLSATLSLLLKGE